METGIMHEIIKIVGKENVLSSMEERICYSYDGTFQRGLPDLVVFPAHTKEVVEIVKLANKKHFPIFPRGAGTGLSGGSTPSGAGVALVLSRMNKIKEINREDLLGVVGPGVVTGYFQAFLVFTLLPTVTIHCSSPVDLPCVHSYKVLSLPVCLENDIFRMFSHKD